MLRTGFVDDVSEALERLCRSPQLNLYLDGFLHTKFSTGLVVDLETDLPDVQVDYGDASEDEVRRTSPRVDSAVVGEAVRVRRL